MVEWELSISWYQKLDTADLRKVFSSYLKNRNAEHDPHFYSLQIQSKSVSEVRKVTDLSVATWY